MRFDNRLKQYYRAIIAYSGYILILAGIVELTPLAITFFFPQEFVFASGFLIPSAALLVIGGILWILFRSSRSTVLTALEGGVIVLFCWIIVCLFSALPFIIIMGLNFTQAVFESVSGWTTTGLSVVDVVEAPKCILLWRSIMQLAGGAGLVIIMLSSITGPTGPGLSIAEGRSDQLVPNVRHSAKLVLKLYLTYVILGTIIYNLAGMSFFDAINHSFAAFSTGGFSTHPQSIGYWDLPRIEIITCFFMLCGNLNFITAYLVFKRKFRFVLKNGELHILAMIIPIAFLVLLFGVVASIYQVPLKSIRVSIFEAISAITTTGFSTVSYQTWNGLGFLVLITLMLIGGGASSTAGGIKQYRIYLLLKSIQWRLKRTFLPRTVILDRSIWMGEIKKNITDNHITQISTFIFMYIVFYLIGVFILTLNGYTLRDSLFEFASALGTVGLSIGLTQASSPPVVLWTESLAMFLGRLEFFVIIISIIKLAKDFISFFRTR
ncbi:TrkH family potassium uptake protein [bacterium]|nr:TrkH family potassium uptake protein [bacterium]RQV98097.1 MAG: TrkH family potassium uptake protein [bacterium]